MRYTTFGVIALAAAMTAPATLAQPIEFTEAGDANWTFADGVIMADSGHAGSLTTRQSYGSFELSFEVQAVPPTISARGTDLLISLDCPEGTESGSSYRRGFGFNGPSPFFPDSPSVSGGREFTLTIEICSAGTIIRASSDVRTMGPWQWDSDAWYPFRMRVSGSEFSVELNGACLICPGATSRGPGPVRFTYDASGVFVDLSAALAEELDADHGILRLRNFTLR